MREIDYHAFGEVKSWAYNANSRYERVFDLDGRIEGHTAGNTTRTLDFDPASRIMAIADELGPNDWEYGYDTLDRLTEADNTSIDGPNAGQSLSWAYDLTGNRTGETENAIQTPYQTDPASNRLNQVGTQARVYDAVGNTLDDGQGTQSRYSARNRLIQTTKAALTTRYQHNAFGERVAKTQAGLTTEYVYDDAGHLIGEYPAGPSAVSGTTEVLWLGDTPIAVLKRRAGSIDGGPSGGGSATSWNGLPAGGVEVFYVHPDHLDTPRVLVNGNNQPVWRWDSAPFGDTDANEQPTAGIPSFRFSLRFPGQQYDQETGTHYNYFRDYEPGVGRYVQSDPIGLLGGIVTFNYAATTPISSSDHRGLVPKAAALGALFVLAAERCILGALMATASNAAKQTFMCCIDSCESYSDFLRCDFKHCLKQSWNCQMFNAAFTGCIVGAFQPEFGLIAGFFTNNWVNWLFRCDSWFSEPLKPAGG